MKPEPISVAELIAARTRALCALEGELLESRKALVHLDLDAINRHNAQQEMHLEEIHRLDQWLLAQGTLRHGPGGSHVLGLEEMAADLDADSRERLRLLLEEHEAVRRRVQMLSDVQADLIRRSRRHLDILYNLVTNSMGVYEDPKSKGSSFGAAERGF
jgi:hypothetical protein